MMRAPRNGCHAAATSAAGRTVNGPAVARATGRHGQPPWRLAVPGPGPGRPHANLRASDSELAQGWDFTLVD